MRGLRFGHGKEDRCVADRVDHDEIDDEGGDKALEHASVISRGWVVHPCKGDICVKARARDGPGSGEKMTADGVMIWPDRVPVFPISGPHADLSALPMGRSSSAG